jgi:hypothetical protein
MTEEAHVPAIGRAIQHDAQERRLAPAVRPDDAEEVTRVHGEVDALEDGQLAVTDVDVLELDEGSHRLSTMLPNVTETAQAVRLFAAKALIAAS